MDYLIGILKPFLEKCVTEYVTEQMDYIENLRKNIKDMRNRMDTLASQENDRSKDVKRAKMEQMEIRSEVEDWLKKVEAIKDEVIMIDKEYDKNMKRCFPHYCDRGNLSRRASEALKAIAYRIDENEKFDSVVIDPLPKPAHILPTVSLKGRSAEKAKTQILNWIEDKEVGIIGVHGMGGVGKTTIMENLNNYLKATNLFDYIYFVTVSHDVNLERLQTKIAEEVECPLPKDETKKRAIVLHEALILRQKFLIILDDVWEPYALKEVGIPKPSQENGCKIVLTTRELRVCQGMKTDKDLSVGSLPEDDAWALFEDRVGKTTFLDSNDVESVARRVAKECMGLPLALDVVGAALRHVKDVYEWKHALKQLQGSNSQIPDMLNMVFPQLKFSYDRLNNEKMRACFLYCSLYPEGCRINVDEAIRYWMLEGLIDEEGYMEEGHAIVNRLIRASLLQNFHTNQQTVKYMKMHDLLRDMAIGITNNNPRFIVKCGSGSEEPLKNEEWVGDVQRVSLMKNRITNLSVIPNWPNLTTLFLQDNTLLRHISPSFFQHMFSLKVVNLSNTNITSLPDSLSELVNLRALVLSSCRFLFETPSLSKLTELRVLDLSSTAITQLPLGMEGLSNLRFLILHFTERLQTILPGVLSKHTHLETLKMLHSSFTLKGCSLVDEIVSLRTLAHVTLDFCDFQTFTRYVESGHSQTLSKFTFNIGEARGAIRGKIMATPLSMIKNLFISKHSSFWDCSVCAKSYEGNTEENSFLLPGNTQKLELVRWAQLSLFSLLSRSNVRGLKSCCIYQCKNIKCVSSEESDASLLDDLEELQLSQLKSLEVVYRRVAHYNTFQSLRIIGTYNCPKLEYLFKVGVLKNLHNLEEIIIRRCDRMVEVVSDDEGEITELASNCDDNTFILPKLKYLELQGVHNLQRICGKLLACDFMNCIQIKDCPKLKGIQLSINSPGLKGWIEGERAWWEALDWDEHVIKDVFLPLFVEKPPHLKIKAV